MYDSGFMLSLYAYAGYKLVQYSCPYKDKYTLQLFTLRNPYLKGAIKFSQIHPLRFYIDCIDKSQFADANNTEAKVRVKY